MPVPLFNFPQDVQTLVAKCMRINELGLLSLSSRRSKLLVKSANIRVDKMFLRLNSMPTLYIERKRKKCDSYITITFSQPDGREWKRKSEQDEPARFELPMKISIDRRFDFLETERLPGVVLSHFLEIFHRTQGIDVTLSSNVYDQDTLKEAFKDVKLNKVDVHCNISNRNMDPHNVAYALAHTNRMGINCDIFYPQGYGAREKYHMFSVPAMETAIGRLMIQNFKALRLDCCRISTEQLAVMNCEYFISNFCYFYPREIERFLKMWMQGSASRLKYIELHLRDGISLNGIKSETVSEEVTRTFTAINDQLEFSECRMNGGVDIVRYDNTKATIRAGYTMFRMVVWQ